MITKGQNSKFWILPDGEIENLRGLWHYEWILQNMKKLKKFRMKQSDLGEHTNEGPVRLYALSKGFSRMNYTINGGQLVIEAPDNNWTGKIKDSIFDFAAENIHRIQNITITILKVGFPDKVSIKKTASVNLIPYGRDNEEKMRHIPYITESISEGK